jgi:methionyl-tRNA formyltransferase
LALKLGYLGSAEVSEEFLKYLLDSGNQICLCVTKEPKRRSRGKKESLNPVEKLAREYNIDVSYLPESVKDYNPDLSIVVAFGKILPSHLVNDLAFINVHFSLLPELRGAAPIEWAILSGLKKTGVSIMKITEDLDAGPIYLQKEVEINYDDNLTSLKKKLTVAGKELLRQFLENVIIDPQYLFRASAQTGTPSYARKLLKSDFKITSDMTVKYTLGLVKLERAYIVVNSKTIKLVSAASANNTSAQIGEIFESGKKIFLQLSDGPIELLEVIPESRAKMNARQWFKSEKAIGLKLDEM